MKRHLHLVPPLEQEVPEWAQLEEPKAPSLVPVRIRALSQQLRLAHKLAFDLEEELAKGMEDGIQLPRILVEDLMLTRTEAQELVLTLVRTATLGLILEEE